MKKSVVKYLKTDIKVSIENDVKKIVRYHERIKVGGYHSIPRLVFCYVDYLGSLVYGPDKPTVHAIQYIENYFEKEYKNKSALLFIMWRHGTVHEYDPKVLKLKFGKLKLGWLTNISSKKHNKKDHLSVFNRYGVKKTRYFKINANKLVDDLLESLSRLVKDLEANKAKKRKAQKNFKEVSSIKIIQSLHVNAIVKRDVESQFKNNTQKIAGLINKKAKVIRYY